MERKNQGKIINQLDWTITIVPFIGIITLALLFAIWPEQSTHSLDILRNFLGNQMGFYYILMGLGVFISSLYIAFSRYGEIKLGNLEKPKYSNFAWGTMIFTSTMAADILYWSLIEWAHYANEPYIEELGGVQDWASTYPLLHWGPIPWGFYIALAAAFGFMLHVRGRNKQKFSEAVRPILGEKVDGILGTLIDLIAVFALLAGTATTFSMATPLLSAALSQVMGIPDGIGMTIAILLLIAFVYTATVWFGVDAISKLANLSTYLFFAMLIYFLVGGGEAVYIIETGISSIGRLAQNFLGMVTWLDPLRTSGDGVTGFAQNWTIFYWAYWMAWAVATPFFVGVISEGRTIKNMILGAYFWGISGTFTSFIVFGNFGLAQQMKHGVNIADSLLEGAEPSAIILSIFDQLPFTSIGLILLVVTMIAFYATTFDALTMVVASYSYKKLDVDQEPDRIIRVLWAISFIILPIALIFSENSLNNLQTVAIIAAFPIGIVMILIIASFFKDAKHYLDEEKNI